MDSFLVLITWFCILSVSYLIFKTPTRCALQTSVHLPISIMASLLCFIFGSIIKHLPFIPSSIRIYILSSIITHSYWQFLVFFLEFWTNQRYVLSYDNNSLDFDGIGIDDLNAIMISNHSASPFDYVALACLADHLDRFDRLFIFVKKAFAYIPGLGWVGGLNNYKLLHRNWDIDKHYMSELSQTFIANIDYELVTPWMWLIYPEGTRMTDKKLRQAQAFAKERGLCVYQHLLQPRVKGFSFLTNQLHESLGCVIDLTLVYSPHPPKMHDLMVMTRLSEFVHIHVRIYKTKCDGKEEADACVPKDVNTLNQWLRDRWTDKEELIKRMKGNDINYTMLERSPKRATMYFIFWVFVMHFIWCHLIFGFGYLSVQSMLVLIWMLFPVVIVIVEQSGNIRLGAIDPKDI